MTASAHTTVAGVPQYGERAASLEEAERHALAAVAELGMTHSLRPLPAGATEPGAWRCDLRREGAPVPAGVGFGKGAGAAPRVGAVFEALEHHLSEMPPPGQIVLRDAHRVVAALGRHDAVLALLADGPDQPLACLPYRSVTGGRDTDVPAFLSMPAYLEQPASARQAGGDAYDYRVLCRYSLNSGWAAGVTRADAMVHAINEIIERDAMSLLLIRQFLSRTPPPLRILDAATLPVALAALHRAAEQYVGGRVWLLDMTSDLGVPAYWAYLPAEPGAAARVRGCGASLSPAYAVERALHELIQLDSGVADAAEEAAARIHTEAHPALHRCYLADFSARLGDAVTVPFRAAESPATPEGHLEALLALLRRHGHRAWVWDRYVSDHLAVVNVLVPGMERFMVVTDGQVVLPGPRGLAARVQGNGAG
ncbi:YcaO-like family protein [Streptomyces sp. TS71-3]|uniref:YcaO-like family protein n=1 Tax=Streptomyces sp. TS71-3 TaxID=2733862 RepID=UPI001AFE3E0C|nr:YcaO-like family protein [Streptomyces sp. TS71-3]GHJ41916.1 hypothetical protein Sm713_75250 [Streptomyces sp. TS71-3]